MLPREGSNSRPARTTGPLAPRRPLSRNTDALTLQQRRRRRLYQGREYKGTIHQTDLQRITASLSQSPAPDVVTNKEVHPVIEAEELSTPFPDTSELNASLMGPSPISQSSLPVGLTPISQPSLPASPTFRLPDNESPSYETTEIPLKQPPISIYLLKEITVEVQNEQGVKRTVPLQRKRRDDGKYTQRELLAYVASRRGQPVARDKLLESVFAYGLPDEKYNLTSLTNQFNKCTQFLRQDISKVAAELGIPPLTIISSTRDEWRLLTEECRVIDIDAVERHYTLIDGVSGDDSLKPAVQMACQALIDVYRGDFLENSVESAVREGGDDWVDSWIRQPYTLYRTKYFQALWYRAEFWRIKGDLSSDASEAERTLQRNWYEMAAKLYREYALHATTNFTDESAMLFDLEIKQRVSLGERALRAGLDMYAATKNTQAGDALYLTFAQHMAKLSLEQWRPRTDTVEAWKKLKEQTKS
ncbi:MAG: hypothetical protein JOZ18_04790, partial [Chloroflexi bacterium]|nr:hypothetical protein [Chloroflexota bacterium]